jgi:glycine cleavage system transcriptional repressor
MANHTALVSIMCEDRPGLIADVTGRLYDLGINLGDTTFAVLGGGAKLTLVAKLPSDISIPAAPTSRSRRSPIAKPTTSQRTSPTGSRSPAMIPRG